MNLTIREAMVSDLEEILNIENSCSGMPWTRAQMEEELSYRYAHTFVAEKDSRIVGFYTPVRTYSKERKAEWAMREWENVNES